MLVRVQLVDLMIILMKETALDSLSVEWRASARSHEDLAQVHFGGLRSHEHAGLRTFEKESLPFEEPKSHDILKLNKWTLETSNRTNERR